MKTSLNLPIIGFTQLIAFNAHFILCIALKHSNGLYKTKLKKGETEQMHVELD